MKKKGEKKTTESINQHLSNFVHSSIHRLQNNTTGAHKPSSQRSVSLLNTELCEHMLVIMVTKQRGTITESCFPLVSQSAEKTTRDAGGTKKKKNTHSGQLVLKQEQIA